MANLCAGCCTVNANMLPGIKICPDCLMGRFCNDDCMRKGMEEHKCACPYLGAFKIAQIREQLGAGQKFVDWLCAVKKSVRDNKVLPDSCTEQQLDQLVRMYSSAHPRAYEPDALETYVILGIAARYALANRRPASILERLIASSCEVLKNTPPASREDGAWLWSSEPVYTLCLDIGGLLVNMGRPREAVNFIQAVKADLDVALLLDNPESKGSYPLSNLITIYRTYSYWLRECIPKDLTRAQFIAHPDRQKRIEVLKQAVKLGKGLKHPLEGAWCAYNLGLEHFLVEDIDLALQVYRKCLNKLPWNEKSGFIAAEAVHCHIAAGQDTQAGKWIEQLLRHEKRSPGRLSLEIQAELHLHRSLLSRRRGKYGEALKDVVRAEELVRHAEETKQLPPKDVESLRFRLKMDKMDCLEALTGTEDRETVRRGLTPPVGGRLIDELALCQALLEKGYVDRALPALEEFTDAMCKQQGYQYWRWRINGVTLWGERMLDMWEKLVKQHLPEGDKTTAILARIEEMRGLEATMKQKLLEDRRAHAMAQVRQEVTGKPTAEGEGIMDVLEPVTGEAQATDEGSLAGPGGATGEATADHKPSKAARKKRKKRQKKAAQAQHDSRQQAEETELEQSMAGLEVTQEGEASEGEAEAGAVRQREECAICLNELAGEDEEGLACGHVLHASCLSCWASKCASLSIDTTCPVCRGPVVVGL